MPIEWQKIESTEQQVDTNAQSEPKPYNPNSALKAKIAEMEAKDRKANNDNSYDLDNTFEWNENSKEMTEEELESIINDPKKIKEIFTDVSKLKDFNDRLNNSRGMWFRTENNQYLKPEHAVREMLDNVKWDNELLKEIIKVNLHNDFGSLWDWFVVANAIERVEADDDFFKDIANEVSIDEDWHNHASSIWKIQDENYLKDYAQWKNKKELESIIMNNWTFWEKLKNIAQKRLDEISK